jgi:sugar/nucleoside kinase (ribokinase family)
MLSGETNLIRAGKRILELGPKIAVVKKGEHGSYLFSALFQFALPAYPVEHVVDPTGAGDSFAGGFMGQLAASGSINLWNVKRAMAYGTVAASLNVEGFGVEAMVAATPERLRSRFEDFVQFIAL